MVKKILRCRCNTKIIPIDLINYTYLFVKKWKHVHISIHSFIYAHFSPNLICSLCHLQCFLWFHFDESTASISRGHSRSNLKEWVFIWRIKPAILDPSQTFLEFGVSQCRTCVVSDIDMTPVYIITLSCVIFSN